MGKAIAMLTYRQADRRRPRAVVCCSLSDDGCALEWLFNADAPDSRWVSARRAVNCRPHSGCPCCACITCSTVTFVATSKRQLLMRLQLCSLNNYCCAVTTPFLPQLAVNTCTCSRPRHCFPSLHSTIRRTQQAGAPIRERRHGMHGVCGARRSSPSPGMIPNCLFYLVMQAGSRCAVAAQ